jgi:hypothetical protein
MGRYLILDKKIGEDNFSLIRKWRNIPDLGQKMREDTLFWIRNEEDT